MGAARGGGSAAVGVPCSPLLHPSGSGPPAQGKTEMAPLRMCLGVPRPPPATLLSSDGGKGPGGVEAQPGPHVLPGGDEGPEAVLVGEGVARVPGQAALQAPLGRGGRRPLLELPHLAQDLQASGGAAELGALQGGPRLLLAHSSTARKAPPPTHRAQRKGHACPAPHEGGGGEPQARTALASSQGSRSPGQAGGGSHPPFPGKLQAPTHRGSLPGGLICTPSHPGRHRPIPDGARAKLPSRSWCFSATADFGYSQSCHTWRCPADGKNKGHTSCLLRLRFSAQSPAPVSGRLLGMPLERGGACEGQPWCHGCCPVWKHWRLPDREPGGWFACLVQPAPPQPPDGHPALLSQDSRCAVGGVCN